MSDSFLPVFVTSRDGWWKNMWDQVYFPKVTKALGAAAASNNPIGLTVDQCLDAIKDVAAQIRSRFPEEVTAEYDGMCFKVNILITPVGVLCSTVKDPQTGEYIPSGVRMYIDLSDGKGAWRNLKEEEWVNIRKVLYSPEWKLVRAIGLVSVDDSKYLAATEVVPKVGSVYWNHGGAMGFSNVINAAAKHVPDHYGRRRMARLESAKDEKEKEKILMEYRIEDEGAALTAALNAAYPKSRATARFRPSHRTYKSSGPRPDHPLPSETFEDTSNYGVSLVDHYAWSNVDTGNNLPPPNLDSIADFPPL